MTQTEKAFVIINPNAGRKRGLHDWPLISALLEQTELDYTYLFTEMPGDAGKSVKEATSLGFRHIIAIGGDGTFNEVVNGIISQQNAPSAEVRLSMIPVGTGNDWCRMYNIPKDYSAAINVIQAGKCVHQDVGRLEYTANSNREHRFFINVAGMGMDARVVFDTNRRKERGSAGKVAYLMSLISATFAYKSLPVVIRTREEEFFNGFLYSANVGICRFSGGGMQQVPFAIPDDALFDVTIIRKVNKMKVLWNIRNLYDGSFVKLKEVSTHRCDHLIVESDAPLLLEADGESLGSPPFIIDIMPGALKITVN